MMVAWVVRAAKEENSDDVRHGVRLRPIVGSRKKKQRKGALSSFSVLFFG